MNNYALILAGGEEVGEKTVLKYAEKANFIIGADKGAETAYRYKFDLDLVVGDFDSINSEILNHFNTEIIEYPKEKDKTDLELAIDILEKKGYKNIIIINALGNRIDHTLGNVFLLEKYPKINIRIIDNISETFLVNKNEIVLRNKIGYILSIIPISKNIEIENLTGVKYPLQNKKVERGSSLCISNLIEERECLISIKKGRAFMIITKNMED